MDSRPQRTLADVIVERIKEKNAQVSSGILISFDASGYIFLVCFLFCIAVKDL